MSKFMILSIIGYVIITILLSNVNVVHVDKIALSSINQRVIEACKTSDVDVVTVTQFVMNDITINTLCKDGSRVIFHI